MTLAEYIKKTIDSDFVEEQMPFPLYTLEGIAEDVICPFDKVEDKMYFLKKGIVEVQMLNKNGDIRILDFFLPDDFFCSFSSFLKQTPSEVNIIAITDFSVEYCLRKDLLGSYRHSLIANQLGRVETERLYLKHIQREKDLLTKTAEEIYTDLILHKSILLEHLSIDKLARYLGIHPESLSRIRRKKININ